MQQVKIRREGIAPVGFYDQSISGLYNPSLADEVIHSPR